MYTRAHFTTPEALLAIDEQRVGLDLEIVFKTGLVLQQHLDTNDCLESVFSSFVLQKEIFYDLPGEPSRPH